MSSTTDGVRIVGRYALYGVLASGGMATVHFGRLIGPVGFSRTVAIKRLHPQFASDPEFVAMFLDEARLAARIRHPHVVPTLDVVATSGELFLVMEYVPGESLARLVRAARARGAVIPVPITVAVMAGVLQGLHAAHEAKNEQGAPLGIVHRDVSPQNVLVGADGQARVLDFGVAKAAGRVQTTREGQLKGKLAYMAPEQLGGESCSRRTDIYASAVVLWEALTGERLFRGDNEGAVVGKVLAGAEVMPSRANSSALDAETRRTVARLDAIVMRGLAREPGARFETAREMSLALERAVAPATASQVSEWIEAIASDVLLVRAAQIAEIESSSAELPRSSMPPSERGIVHAAAPPAAPPAAESTSGVSSAGNRPSDAQSGGGISSLSVAASRPAPARGDASRRRSLLLIVAVVSLMGASFAAALSLRPGRSAAVAVAAAPGRENGTGASTPQSASTAGTPQPPATASVATETSPSAAPAGSGSADGARVSAPPAVQTPPSDTRGVRKSAPPRANACNPPFTYDQAGMKHYKPECL